MITFTRDWNGYPAGASVGTLAATTEAAAVAAGAAVYGGTSYPLRSGLDQYGNVTSLVDGDGNVFAVVEVTPYVAATASAGATLVTGPCELAGYDCTVAAGNITIYDGTNTSGRVIVPTTALSVGRVEFQWKRALTTGCHVVLSGAGTVNVLVG